MRSKITLAAAILLAAGISHSVAQSNVYSLNVVGYVVQSYPVGWSMAANPLRTTNNFVGGVLSDPPAGTAVFKFSGGAFEPANTYFGAGFWGNNSQRLPPGQGFFIGSQVLWTNVYVGEVVMDNTNSLIHGWNMIGSAWPAAGAMDTNLQLVPTFGDAVFVFNNGAGYNSANIYYGAGFWGSGNPQLNVAQGVMYYSAAANNWVQHFVIPSSALKTEAIVPPQMLLSITRTVTNTVAVTWPSPSTGWTLQQNTNSVASVNWSNVISGVQDDGTTKALIVKPTTGSRFYRLIFQ